MSALLSGNAVVYDIHGRLVKNFVLAPGDATLVECHFWGNGVVGLSADMQLFVYEVLSLPSLLLSRHSSSRRRVWSMSMGMRQFENIL
jgi:hypothetical protein